MSNRRDDAILEWTRKHRPDILSQVGALLENDWALLLTSVAFEAGRQFQADNPELELDNPNVYLQPT